MENACRVKIGFACYFHAVMVVYVSAAVHIYPAGIQFLLLQ